MKSRAPRNRTLICDPEEITRLSKKILYAGSLSTGGDVCGTTICGDTFEVVERLPRRFVDLLIFDPPYNLSKNYNGQLFKERNSVDYQEWFRRCVCLLMPTLKPTASVYVCSDWKTSIIIAPVLEKYFHVRNRITWEREKGRGSKTNWKNNTEDIWFCTVSNDYFFDVNSVKLKRKVIAPYRVNGKPKDWHEDQSGNYRLTYPSNIWTDVTIPFWSMPENTSHPTQKPEKLIAKLLLASSKENDFVFDPFLGSGTTSVVAKKLERKYCGVEINEEYCCWALKRLEMAISDQSIQGYSDGVFWERNTRADQNRGASQVTSQQTQLL